MRKINATMIGVFVLGAIVLVILGIIALGAGRFFIKHPTFVMYFMGSAKGLSDGAQVVFKGVKVGKVTDIGLQYNPETKSVIIIVLAEINLDTITGPSGEKATMSFFLQLIRQGLKAQLQYQNFLTGLLLIDLDFHPGKPTRLVRSTLPYPQIPTTPSSLESISKVVEKLPLDEIISKLANTVEAITAAARSPEFKHTIKSIRLAADELQKLARTINENARPLTEDIRGTLHDSRRLLKDFGKESSSLMSGMEEATNAVREAALQAEQTLRSLENAGSGGSPAMYQLSKTLEKVSDAADSLRALSDYLSRHPEALLRGKKAQEKR